MYDKLMDVLNRSGMWSGTRRTTHGFLLSPDVFAISERQNQELTKLGWAIFDCLQGLSHIAHIAYDGSFNYAGPWLRARRIFSTGVPRVYQELQGLFVGHLPQLLKVDLMVDEAGNFRIAEIDGHNKHGVGYSTLALRMREALYPDVPSLPGTVRALAAEVRRLGSGELKLLYADQERFYRPEFEVVQQELQLQGIACRVVSETEATTEFLESGLFMDLPFLNRRPELYKTIVPAYKSGSARFVIPPKPFLGAKGLLALLRNDAGDDELEGMVRTFIPRGSLERVRSYIPETVLVGRHAEDLAGCKARLGSKRYVLKESISSGMKGTLFSGENGFDAMLERASGSNLNWILQEEVRNQPRTFAWYENGQAQPVLRSADDWYMRVTAQFVNRRLSDVIVTARRDKAVHGAKDCLQLGTVIR